MEVREEVQVAAPEPEVVKEEEAPKRTDYTSGSTSDRREKYGKGKHHAESKKPYGSH